MTLFGGLSFIFVIIDEDSHEFVDLYLVSWNPLEYHLMVLIEDLCIVLANYML